MYGKDGRARLEIRTTTNTSYKIEFIGGPYDGYRQTLATPFGELAEIVALPVSRDIYRLLDGETRGQGVPITSVAVYQLEKSGNSWRHRFLGGASPQIPDVPSNGLPQSTNRQRP